MGPKSRFVPGIVRRTRERGGQREKCRQSQRRRDAETQNSRDAERDEALSNDSRVQRVRPADDALRRTRCSVVEIVVACIPILGIDQVINSIAKSKRLLLHRGCFCAWRHLPVYQRRPFRCRQLSPGQRPRGASLAPGSTIVLVAVGFGFRSVSSTVIAARFMHAGTLAVDKVV